VPKIEKLNALLQPRITFNKSTRFRRCLHKFNYFFIDASPKLAAFLMTLHSGKLEHQKNLSSLFSA